MNDEFKPLETIVAIVLSFGIIYGLWWILGVIKLAFGGGDW